VFERNITEIAAIVHAAGACSITTAPISTPFSARRGRDMGFDVMHMNLHKTFATPHGGGGPGAGRWRSTPGWSRFCDSLRRPRTAGAIAG